MWSLIKHEIRYDLDLILASTLLVVIIFTGMISLEVERGISIIPGIPFLFIIMLQLMLISRRHLEKRTRIQRILPLSVQEVGFTRILFQICLWAVVLFLFVLQALIRSDWNLNSAIVQRFMYLASSLWLANAALNISEDVWYDIRCRSGTLRRSMLIPLWVTVIVLVLLYQDSHSIDPSIQPFPAILVRYQSRFVGIEVIVCLGLILTMWSVIIYIRRKSYLS